MDGKGGVLIFLPGIGEITTLADRISVSAAPETPKTKPEIRNPESELKPEIRNPKPETRNPKSETRNQVVGAAVFAAQRASPQDPVPLHPPSKKEQRERC